MASIKSAAGETAPRKTAAKRARTTKKAAARPGRPAAAKTAASARRQSRKRPEQPAGAEQRPGPAAAETDAAQDDGYGKILPAIIGGVGVAAAVAAIMLGPKRLAILYSGAKLGVKAYQMVQEQIAKGADKS